MREDILSSSIMSVLSFGAALEMMEEQTELETLIRQRPDRERLYREIVRIAADAYTHGVDRPVTVDGEDRTYGWLCEVYADLTSEHIELVADNLGNYRREIRYKKAFIRTALANSVFEAETTVENQYATRLYGGNV